MTARDLGLQFWVAWWGHGGGRRDASGGGAEASPFPGALKPPPSFYRRERRSGLAPGPGTSGSQMRFCQSRISATTFWWFLDQIFANKKINQPNLLPVFSGPGSLCSQLSPWGPWGHRGAPCSPRAAVSAEAAGRFPSFLFPFSSTGPCGHQVRTAPPVRSHACDDGTQRVTGRVSTGKPPSPAGWGPEPPGTRWRSRAAPVPSGCWWESPMVRPCGSGPNAAFLHVVDGRRCARSWKEAQVPRLRGSFAAGAVRLCCCRG